MIMYIFERWDTISELNVDVIMYIQRQYTENLFAPVCICLSRKIYIRQECKNTCIKWNQRDTKVSLIRKRTKYWKQIEETISYNRHPAKLLNFILLYHLAFQNNDNHAIISRKLLKFHKTEFGVIIFEKCSNKILPLSIMSFDSLNPKVAVRRYTSAWQSLKRICSLPTFKTHLLLNTNNCLKL